MAEKRPRDEDATNAADELAAPRANTREELDAPVVNPFTGTPFSSRYQTLLRVRERLPVYAKKQLIMQTVLANAVTVLVGETGSGKTTQVPHFIAELRTSFPGIVACTQPRRIAAVSVAARVADEMDVRLGEQVGYHVRFQSVRSDSTCLLYLTDGMLLREAFSDADLSRYSVVVVDEAHERTVDTDVLLGLLKQLTERRSSFRLVVMSATLDIAKIQQFFPAAPLLTVSGRMYDVQVHYSKQPVQDYVAAAVERVLQLHANEPAGDILCFLTGEAEVERAVAATSSALASSVKRDGPTSAQLAALPAEDDGAEVDPARPRAAIVLPLFGSLGMSEQQKVFDSYPVHVRKIVYATNIAETSVTIDGVVYVVDCGYQKQSLYSSQARVDYLLPAVISQASAEQRKGRAGRTRAGKCFRLFTEADYATFPRQSHPEILRTNIVNTILLLLNLGVQNVMNFPFLDVPSEESLGDAFYQLTYFEAVDDELQLTAFGKKMAEFPVDACLARMLLKSADHRCAADAAVVAAMLEAGHVFLRPPSRAQEADAAHRAFLHPAGDHVARFLLFHDFYRHSQSGGNAVKYCWEHYLRLQTLQQAVQIYGQLRRLMSQQNLPILSTYKADTHTVDTVVLRKAVLEGFFTQVAYRRPGLVGDGSDVYHTVRDAMPIHLHRQSSLGSALNKFGPKTTWLMYDRLEVHGADGTFARVGSPIEVDWLLDTSDYYLELTEIPDRDIAYALRMANEARKKKQAGATNA